MSDLTTSWQTRGATLVEVEGVSTAARFGDPAAEYTALRTRAGVVDWAWCSRLHMTGTDRASFLQGMLSNEVTKLAVGKGCPALLLSEQGKVIADVMVLAGNDEIVLAGSTASLVAGRAALERFIVADDVEIVADDDAAHVFAVLGPEAAQVVERVGLQPPLAPYDHLHAELSGADVHLARVPGPAAGGFVLHVPVAAAATVWAALVDAGAAAPVGYEAFEVLRIESGMPWHGRDVTADTLALEAPYEAAISFRKGCYLGQEVMERVTARGHVNRKLVGLALAGDVVPPSGVRVFAGDRDVGWVTSAAWSWRLGHGVALAYVRREHLEPGTTLVIGDPSGVAAADAAEIPAGDPPRIAASDPAGIAAGDPTRIAAIVRAWPL
ncbi:MAG: glycine cleavage T C-terminal barrel domain-containing protein [Candidatus Binatia bacterium]